MRSASLSHKVPKATAVTKPMRKVRLKQVDAFTETPLTGNPAGVVMDATGLTEREMQTIAQEVSVSETAFVLPPSVPGADLRIRWFTPQTEVPLCGHATIATFHALAEECKYGMESTGTYKFRLDTKSGVLPVTVHKNEAAAEVLFGLNLPLFVRAGQHKLDLIRVLNISLEELESRLPIVVADYAYVPIRRLHSIFSMKPNFFAMSQFLTRRNLTGLCVFSTETVDRTSAVHSRFFAPTLGVNEDPVTGSANGPLGVYLYTYGQLKSVGDSITLIGEQGDVIGRKGRVTIHLEMRGDQVTSVKIGGRAVTVLDGEIVIG